MKLFISPKYEGIDTGRGGGIRRIVDAQRDYFADQLVENVEDADTVAIHAGSLVKLRSDQKVFAHCHGFLWSKYIWPEGHMPINKLVMDSILQSDFITAPTEWVAQSIRRMTNRHVSVIPHAVDPIWTPSSTHENYILWNKSREDQVCSLEPLYRVASNLPNLQFKSTIEAEKLVKPSNVEIIGLQSYANIEYVQNAGVYLATAQETFGIGILEALACGVPVVGWNWGGASDIVPNGWLSNEGDYKDLANKIEYALAHRNELSEQCVEIASHYTWDRVMAIYDQLYRAALPEKRVSVIVRNYNLSKYLPDCIESIKPQLTSEDELFVVDDCSTDNSLAICQDLGVVVHKTPRNLHLAGALNYAMNKANGRYILHIDADNQLGPRAIQALTQKLDNDRTCDIAYGRVKWVSEDGITDAGFRSEWPPVDFDLDAQLKHKNQIPCASMYRRKVFEAAGPYRARCRVAEDADFWCRATTLGYQPKQATTAQTLIYRVRQDSLSNTTDDWPWEKWFNGPVFKDNQVNSFEPVLISVIIPVGPGHGIHLQDAVDSLAMQSFRNWECIIVNDTGRQLTWVPKWAKVINTFEKASGPSVARNLGLDHAKGKVWLALDADDYLCGPDALMKMLSKMAKNENSYVYTDYRRDGKVTQTREGPCNYLKEGMPHILTGLYPVNSIRFDPEIEIGEDWDYVLAQTKAGFCGVRVPEPLVFYRLGSGNRRKEYNPTHKEAILKKWGSEPMACKTCEARANMIQSQMKSMNISMEEQLKKGELVKIRYLGPREKKYYDGKMSGRTYAFGSVPGMKEKSVLAEDVNGFVVDMGDLFELVNVLAANPLTS